MREIGGYFELEQFHGQEYHVGAVALNSGRNCLLYLLRARKIRKLYIPHFMCEVVFQVCDFYDFAYECYPIDERLQPVFEKKLAEDEYLYILNAYGQLDNECIGRLKKRYGNVIVDNVMDFFRCPVSGIDTIYSCRKFFGVPDGGYLYTDVSFNVTLEEDRSADRMEHLLGRLEASGQTYFGAYHENEARIDEMPLRVMSKVTRNLLRGIDYRLVMDTRERNYTVLAKVLDSINLKKFTMSEGPFCYPLLCENGLELRKALAKEKIYVSTLWPNVLNSEQDPVALRYSRDILPIPCDQRYGPEEMAYVAEKVMGLIVKNS